MCVGVHTAVCVARTWKGMGSQHVWPYFTFLNTHTHTPLILSGPIFLRKLYNNYYFRKWRQLPKYLKLFTSPLIKTKLKKKKKEAIILYYSQHSSPKG